MLVASLAFVACEKNEDSNLTDLESAKHNLKSNNIMHFQNQDHLAQVLVDLSQRDLNEKWDFAYENNYQSFGVHCDQLYLQVAQDSLDPASVMAAANAYDEYLMLEPDDSIEGDLIFKTRFQDHPLYYIINMEYMYIVGDYAYKLFPEGLIETHVDYFDELGNVNSFIDGSNEDYFRQIPNDPNFDLDPPPPTPHNAGTKKVARKTNGKNRTKAFINIYKIADNAPQYISDHIVRPYKKTLGIWYWCKRTITYDFNIAVDTHYDNGSVDIDRWRFAGIKKRYMVNADRGVLPGTDYSHVHYRGYDCMGDTPDTPPVIFSKYTFNL